MENGHADKFAKLAYQLHVQEGFEETLEKLVESAPATVGCHSAGVLVTSKHIEVEAAAATDTVADKAGRLEVEYDQGPGGAAIAEARTVLVPDVQAETRWPQWVAGATDLGVGSVLAVRLWTSHTTLGSLNLYATSAQWFDADALGVAEIVARHASIALASARHEESLWQAIDSRKLIGQAQGILMERFDLDGGRAFEVLRRYSQDTNTKLVEVARRLAQTRELPGL